jgi:hypothetical protein
VDQSRFEHALHATKGLGDLRRDVTILVAVAAPMFLGLRLLAPGSIAGNLLYSLLVGFGVLVVLPLFELLWNYRRAPSEEELRKLEQERYRSLRERFRRARGAPPEVRGPE